MYLGSLRPGTYLDTWATAANVFSVQSMQEVFRVSNSERNDNFLSISSYEHISLLPRLGTNFMSLRPSYEQELSEFPCSTSVLRDLERH